MVRSILAGIWTLALLGLQAQEISDNHINKADINGRKQGLWKVYDEDGNLRYTGNYADGKPMGTFTYYYPSGKVKARMDHLDSGRVIYAKNFHPNGILMAEGKYTEQKKDSIWRYYNEQDGSLAAEERYMNNLKDGVWKVYYPEGMIAEEVTYLNDKKEGAWIQYFTDGKIKSKASWINDRLEGLYLVYHLNGFVEVSGNYIHSERNGIWIFNNDKGELEKREEYINGELVNQEIFIEAK
jgi:antitoxin component YwqK of YwqJK toxin-antitoxin module